MPVKIAGSQSGQLLLALSPQSQKSPVSSSSPSLVGSGSLLSIMPSPSVSSSLGLVPLATSSPSFNPSSSESASFGLNRWSIHRHRRYHHRLCLHVGICTSGLFVSIGDTIVVRIWTVGICTIGKFIRIANPSPSQPHPLRHPYRDVICIVRVIWFIGVSKSLMSVGLCCVN